MRSWIILSAVLITLTMVTPSFGDEPATNPEDGVISGWNETYQLMKEAFPQTRMATQNPPLVAT
jgi:hypothetical protein